MQFALNDLLSAYPQVKEFLGSIADSGELPDLSVAEREGIIAELGALFVQRLAAYVQSSLDEESLETLEGLLAESEGDRAVYARLRAVIPQFDSDLERLCLAFHAEYAVGVESAV
jgi:hypothetical protein